MKKPRTLFVHAHPGMDGPETYFEPMQHCPTRRHNKDGCPKCIEFVEVLPQDPALSPPPVVGPRQD